MIIKGNDKWRLAEVFVKKEKWDFIEKAKQQKKTETVNSNEGS